MTWLGKLSAGGSRQTGMITLSRGITVVFKFSICTFEKTLLDPDLMHAQTCCKEVGDQMQDIRGSRLVCLPFLLAQSWHQLMKDCPHC